VAILHVDDQVAIREIVRRALEAFGFAVVSADGARAAKLALAEQPDLAGALLDMRLRDGDGGQIYEWIRDHRPDLMGRVAFLTGSADTALHAQLAATGCPVLSKPFEITELVTLAAAWEGRDELEPRRGPKAS